MKIWTLKIELENDAFQPMPGPAAALQVGRILDGLREDCNKTGQLPRRGLKDINGNTCGVAYIAIKADPWDPRGGGA